MLKESIKYFESLQKRYATQHNGKQCEYVKTALTAMRKQLLQKDDTDLINRQKAEIERLQKNIDGLNIFTKNHIKVIRLQVIKEFEERLKEKLQWDVEFDNKLVFESDIDNIVKEMEGMENEKSIP